MPVGRLNANQLEPQPIVPKGSVLHCLLTSIIEISLPVWEKVFFNLLIFWSLSVMSFIWWSVRVRLWCRSALTFWLPIRKTLLYLITHKGLFVQYSILSSSCQLFPRRFSSLTTSWPIPPFSSVPPTSAVGPPSPSSRTWLQTPEKRRKTRSRKLSDERRSILSCCPKAQDVYYM